MDWLWVCIIFYITFTLIDIAYFFYGISFAKAPFYYFFVLISIVFYGYFGIKQTDIYIGRLKNIALDLNLEKQNIGEQAAEVIVTNEEVLFIEAEKTAIYNKIVELMEKENFI